MVIIPQNNLSVLNIQVLSYHHRNIGKTQSPASKHVPQTPATLAHDAVALIDHIWGPSAPVHVFGASMGGVVAQHTAVMLHQKGRLRSLFVNVTWDGSGRLGSSWLASFLKPMCTLPVVRHILLPLVFPHRNNPDKQAMNTMKSVGALVFSMPIPLSLSPSTHAPIPLSLHSHTCRPTLPPTSHDPTRASAPMSSPPTPPSVTHGTTSGRHTWTSGFAGATQMPLLCSST